MAKFEEAFRKVLKLEFSSPANALHYNVGEKGYTYMGIYEYAHPHWKGWSKIHETMDKERIKSKASSMLYYDKALTELVAEFYKKEFWDKMRLDEVDAQVVAEEMFVFGVNAGTKRAVKLAQKVVKVSVDGVIGKQTLGALNKAIPAEFSTLYDLEEIEYYEGLVAKNEKFTKYLKGWRNRALAI